MAFTGSSICLSFKAELLQGIHNFSSAGGGGDTFMVALYGSTATLTQSTPTYTAVGEVSGTNYTAGGVALSNLGVFTAGTVVFTGFSNAVWTNTNVMPYGALLYNATKGNRAVMVFDFGGLKPLDVNGNCTVVMPTTDSLNALFRY